VANAPARKYAGTFDVSEGLSLMPRVQHRGRMKPSGLSGEEFEDEIKERGRRFLQLSKAEIQLDLRRMLCGLYRSLAAVLSDLCSTAALSPG